MCCLWDVLALLKSTFPPSGFCLPHNLLKRPAGGCRALQVMFCIGPPESTAAVTCNHVIATCHSTAHCISLDISIKFHCKSGFKTPKLVIKTEI